MGAGAGSVQKSEKGARGDAGADAGAVAAAVQNQLLGAGAGTVSGLQTR